MNVPFTLAFGITVLALILHTFTFEHWIWPELTKAGFPKTPFTNHNGTKSYFRATWYFHTVMFLMSIGALAALAFVDDFAGKNVALATYLGIQWLLILVSIFVNTYIAFVHDAADEAAEYQKRQEAAEPGEVVEPAQSYIGLLLNSWQLLIVAALVLLIFWGIKNCH